MPHHPTQPFSLRLSRWLRHLGTWRAHARWMFPPRSLDAIEAAIRASEADHRCEIRLVIEAAMPLRQVWHGHTCRERATALFRQLHIGKTIGHTGILLYINVADHDIELVADKGITAIVPQDTWHEVVRILSQGFAQQRYQESALHALAALHRIATTHLPAHARAAGGDPGNQLSDRPLML